MNYSNLSQQQRQQQQQPSAMAATTTTSNTTTTSGGKTVAGSSKQASLKVAGHPSAGTIAKYPSRYDIPIQTQTVANLDDSMTNSINHMMNNSYTYNYNPKYRVTRLPNPPSFLQHGALQFVIMDAPTDDNLRSYIKELKGKAVRCVVRTCEPTYSEEPLMAQHINVRDLPFPDGHPPSDDIISQWLDVVNDENYRERRPVAVHCVAGLGRAPVLVAIALMEIGNINPLDAIHLIRKIRRGAINQKQYQYLKSYVRKSKHNCCGCTIL